MDEGARRDLFLKISSVLCGVAVDSFKRSVSTGPPTFPKAGDLAPRNSPINRAGEFLALLVEKVEARKLDAMLERFRDAPGGETGSRVVVAAMLDDATDGPICRSIMKMWFLGAWYPSEDPLKADHVISTQAYKEALVWKVAQAHPMGYSVWTFGYWASDPPPLAEFVTLNDQEPR